MRRFGLLAAAAIFVAAACGVDHGYVTSKRDVAAHDEERNGVCLIHSKSSDPSSFCILYSRYTAHVPRACYVTLQNERESGDRSIDCPTWDRTAIGDYVEKK